jgi:periplasmic divalent cation tolerance protein
MAEDNQYIVVLVTAKDSDEARKIARGLLDEKLIACANTIGNIQSLFLWQGKIDEAGEVLLVLKTRKDLFDQVALKVKSLHSYDTPEIIAIPVLRGNSDYLNWIDLSVIPK